ncbi:hypothetical protein KEM56_007568 [Ascosphaera pollenicola]|nr:hypothetical protein KEM56_007568 [Ascosphaera pollenicola]
MPTRLHKNRKSRGHVSAGHGRIGKHRKHPGGRGLAGGQVGMRRFHLLRNQLWKPSVNLDKLMALVPEETREKYLSADAPKDQALVFDLLSLGYSKLLGKGRLPNIPMVIKARYVSKEAERKITENGGVIELVA